MRKAKEIIQIIERGAICARQPASRRDVHICHRRRGRSQKGCQRRKPRSQNQLVTGVLDDLLVFTIKPQDTAIKISIRLASRLGTGHRPTDKRTTNARGRPILNIHAAAEFTD